MHPCLTPLTIVMILALLGGSVCAGAEPGRPADAEPPTRPPIIRWQTITPVSDSFASEFGAAANTIPAEVWRTVIDAGWRVDLAEYVVDAAPSLRGVAPRGWPVGWVWENTDAVHLPGSRRLIVAEKRRTRTGKIVPCSRVGGVLRHELGHAFDLVSGGFYRSLSMRPEFLAAYQADLKSMPDEYRQKLEYYLQPAPSGPQEAFAEAFGVLFGGGSDVTNVVEFHSTFKLSVASVRRTLEDSIAAGAIEPTRQSLLDARSKVLNHDEENVSNGLLSRIR